MTPKLFIVNWTVSHADYFYKSEFGMFRLTLCVDTHKLRAAWLSTLIVDNEHRDRGIGNELLAYAEEQSKKLGCTALSLEVEWKSWVRNWYERHGFVAIAEGINEDFVVMTKIL